MKIDEALKTLDQVCAGYQGTRQEHVTLQQAMQTVAKAIHPAGENKEKKESDGNK